MTSDGREQHSASKSAPATPNGNISALVAAPVLSPAKRRRRIREQNDACLKDAKTSAGCNFASVKEDREDERDVRKRRTNKKEKRKRS
jgi:hypothetical protein